MINGLGDALKSINCTVYNNRLAIDSLNYAWSFLLILAENDYRLNQLHNGLIKLEPYVSTIYKKKTFNVLINKIVAPTLIDLTTNLGVQNQIFGTLHISEGSPYHFQQTIGKFDKVTPFINISHALVSPTQCPSGQHYAMKDHTNTVAKTILGHDHDQSHYYAHPMEINIMKYFVFKGHFCSLSWGIYPVKGSNEYALGLYFNININIQNYCSVSVNNIMTNTITQIKSKFLPHGCSKKLHHKQRCPGNMDTRNVISIFRCSNPLRRIVHLYPRFYHTGC